MAGASTGVDGVITVDGTANTLTDVTAGATVTLNSGSGGTISATLNALSALPTVNSSLLSTGTVTATNISTGNGSLANMVANINSAGTGIIASAVQTGTNQYILQLSSSTTGTAADLSVDANAFSSSSLGSLRTATAGSNAQIQVGGAGGYTLNSQTDTFAGLLPGLSVTVASTTTDPVTVTVAPDATAMSTAVESMVTAANTVLSDIQQYAGYDAATKVAGPLMGSAVLQNLQNQILGIFAGDRGLVHPGQRRQPSASRSTTARSTSTSRRSSPPSAPTRPGWPTSSPRGAASPRPRRPTTAQSASPTRRRTSQAGSYDVTISQSATQATDAGSTLSGGTVGAAETLTIAADGLSVNYATTAGETLANVASGINAALAGAGISLSAQVRQRPAARAHLVGLRQRRRVLGHLRPTPGRGPPAWPVRTAGTAASFNGTDVAGTINGVAATGSGQFLSAPVTDPDPGRALPADLGERDHLVDRPGHLHLPAGHRPELEQPDDGDVEPVNGSITLAAQGLTTQATSMNTEISFDQTLAAAEQKSLQAEYSQLEVTLGSIKDQSSALSQCAGQPQQLTERGT